MSEADPRQAILDLLARPAGRWQPGPRSPGGWQSGTVCGGPSFQADLSTVRFVKHRESKRRQLHYVTFGGTIPHIGPGTHRLSWLFPLERDPDGGWRSMGGAGGGNGTPKRSTPWINLAGGGWPDQFYAGGHIDAAGADIAHVQLRFADGVTLEDDSDEGIALFITDHSVVLPATVVLLDHVANELATHAFPGLHA